MRGVHPSLNHVATAVVRIRVVVGVRIIAVSIRIIVSVVVIVAVRVEAESEAAPEVAIMESTTVMIVESISEAATMTTITESASHATMEAATFEAATTEAATGKAAVATAYAASVATAAATRQRYCWRNQANGCNRQQRDNRFAQHHHSPSEISLPTTTLAVGGDRKIAIDFDEPAAQVFASDAGLNLKLEARRCGAFMLQM